MVGKPKYKLNDTVKFACRMQEDEEPRIFTGKIEVIDEYGTFFDDSDVSYDIFVESMNMSFKHFTEASIIEKVEDLK